MSKCKLARAFLLSLLLSGCSSVAETAGPRPRQDETQTPVRAAATSPATLQVTGTAEPGYPEGCINLSSIALDHAKLEGTLVVRDENLKYYLLEAKTGRIAAIDEDQGSIPSPVISPNGKFMLAQTCINGQCHYVLRTVDKVVKTILLPSEDWFVGRWLDNERVVLVSRTDQNEVRVLNPFTGEQRNVYLDLRNPYAIQAGKSEQVVPTSLSPSLKRIVFNDQSGSVILWNLEIQEEVASLPFADPVSSFDAHVWSPDGQRFVTTSPNAALWSTPPAGSMWAANELFTLDVDGNLTQLTNYNHNDRFANITSPEWSPDNRHIGFWLKIGEAKSIPENLRQWLAVLDINTFETTVYCLAFSVPSLSAFPIVWSPDGQRLIANTRLANGNVIPTLVDLTDHTQAAIDGVEGVLVEDWMEP